MTPTAPDEIAAVALLARGQHSVGEIETEQRFAAWLTLERLRAAGIVISHTSPGGFPVYRLTRVGWLAYSRTSSEPAAV